MVEMTGMRVLLVWNGMSSSCQSRALSAVTALPCTARITVARTGWGLYSGCCFRPAWPRIPPPLPLSLNMGAQSQSAMASDAAAALARLRDGSSTAGATLALVPFPHTTTAVATVVVTAVALLCSWLSTHNMAARNQNPEVTWLHLREGEGRWGKVAGR